ncbi:M1 family aminopeptidase [Niastella caeni]|nr:M1 family aminopeptidase [Niastella caeni]
MFKEYFFSESRFYFRKWWFYGLLLAFLSLGLLTSQVANFSFPGLYVNSPWVLMYIIGLLSLLNIFIITILAAQILFREKDSQFDAILYATPMCKSHFLFSRFTLIVVVTLLCFLLLLSGLMMGHLLRGNDPEKYTSFHLLNYLHPFVVLVLPNAFLCAAIVCTVAWLTRNKLIMYLSGLAIYIFYMVGSLFSNSPLFAGASPPSSTAMALAAKLDPFGLAAFLEQTQYWPVQLRNTQLIEGKGNFLFNRLWVIIFSLIVLFISYSSYRFREGKKEKAKKKVIANEKSTIAIDYKPVASSYSNTAYSLTTFLSFVKLDIRFIVKSISFILMLILWAFFLGMEIYSDIDGGIRLPQRYATSGLMVKNIIGTFPFFSIVVLLFYSVEMLWRSRQVKVAPMERTTPVSEAIILGAKWTALAIVPILLIVFCILIGIAFQLLYHYPFIDFGAYASLFFVLGVPALLYASIIVSIQAMVRKKYAGLVVAALFLLITNSPVGSKLGLAHPLFRFARSFVGYYSDMNGYGAYLQAFGIKMLYWLAFTIIVGMVAARLWGNTRKTSWIKSKKLLKPVGKFVFGSCVVLMFITGTIIYNKTTITTDEDELNWQAQYEQWYRKYQHIAQPTISRVHTRIDLYPENNNYMVTGEYTLVNKNPQPLDSLLLYCNPDVVLQDVKIEKATLVKKDSVFGHYSFRLATSLHPGDSITMQFAMHYRWSPFNRHAAFNAIVENGAFMRISRYYPVFGYQPGNEIENGTERKIRQLAAATPLKKLEEKDSAAYNYGFIQFDAVISTSGNQTAIGTGELKRSWKEKGRNYVHYQSPVAIPFRFAVSSAEYAVKKATQNGIAIEVYYHPGHHENVDHLIEEAKNTIVYCEKNFGKYPFKTIRFAEISRFTEGFNATAYPAVIFMNEGVTFHADLRKEKLRDVINELAAHELAHEWWGTAQIAPEEREGSVMLTETLAMYTELMLYKNTHGIEAMKEVVHMHKDLYEKGKPFGTEEPLYKVKPGNIYLSYNKGLVAMHQLYELIGEEKLNLALKNFITKYAYPNHPPTTIDLINEFLLVSDPAVHRKIKGVFM